MIARAALMLMALSSAALAQQAAEPAREPPAALGQQAGGAGSPDGQQPQEADLRQGLACATLTQQFGDAVATAKAGEEAMTKAKDAAAAGRQACAQHSYGQGIEKLREALSQIGKKPIR